MVAGVVCAIDDVGCVPCVAEYAVGTSGAVRVLVETGCGVDVGVAMSAARAALKYRDIYSSLV